MWYKTGKGIHMKRPGLLLAALLVMFSCAKKNEEIFAKGAPPKNTVILAHPDAVIEKNKNYIWCSTIQIAWNELCEKIGEDIHVYNEDPVFTKMNRRAYQKKDIDPASYILLSSFKKDFNLAQARDNVKGKFPAGADTKLLDSIGDYTDDTFFVYAHLFKQLQFEVPFTRDKEGNLEFLNQKVESFNIANSTHDLRKLIDQIIVYYYKNDDEFIIGLTSRSKNDELILAKIPPAKTLEKTNRFVLEKLDRGKKGTFREIDWFNAPVISFDFDYIYPEFNNKILKLKNDVFNKSPLKFKHKITYILNEEGAKLESIDVSDASTDEQEETTRQFVFNRPFLVLMKQSFSRRPYFSMWIGNTELFSKVKK